MRTKKTDTFPTDETLWELTKADQRIHFNFIIGRNYTPDAVEMSNENIEPAIVKELDKLSLLFQYMEAPDQL